NSELQGEKTDFTSFLALETFAVSVTFELLDDNCNVVAVLNDDTYGVYYPKGFFQLGNFFQQQYVGFKIQWRKVLDLLGPGAYSVRIKTVYKEIKKTEIVKSCCFELAQYTDERANETVRIETTQNGYIIGQGLDYTNVNWKEQIRIPGFFGNKQRRLEQDNYLDKNRRTTQIQDSLIHEFTLEPYFWPDCLRDQIDKILLANEILVSDYNLDNTDNLKNISVIPTSIDTEYFGKSQKAADEIKFEERIKNRVKRNVK
ncbi:MAG: hypothetical protein OEM04_12595, partial [Flavobacteriaceae bacterium]|nr:hypothetical protein [Flavobacteriaceae bacterium]